VHNSCELSTTAGRSSSSTVSPLHNKDINEHQQTPPGKTTAFLHAWLGEKSFSSLKTTEKPSSKLCLSPSHALACIVDFLLAISQLVQRGF